MRERERERKADEKDERGIDAQRYMKQRVWLSCAGGQLNSNQTLKNVK